MSIFDHNTNNYNGKETDRKVIIQHWKVIAIGLMIYDAIAIAFSYIFGLWIRFDFLFSEIPTEYLHSYICFLPVYAIAAIIFFWFMRMYRGIWRFVGFNELIRYASASVFASVVHAAAIGQDKHRSGLHHRRQPERKVRDLEMNKMEMFPNTCVCCGVPVPESRMKRI